MICLLLGHQTTLTTGTFQKLHSKGTGVPTAGCAAPQVPGRGRGSPRTRCSRASVRRSLQPPTLSCPGQQAGLGVDEEHQSTVQGTRWHRAPDQCDTAASHFSLGAEKLSDSRERAPVLPPQAPWPPCLRLTCCACQGGAAHHTHLCLWGPGCPPAPRDCSLLPRILHLVTYHAGLPDDRGSKW